MTHACMAKHDSRICLRVTHRSPRMFWVTQAAWRASRRGQLLLGVWALAFISLSLRAAKKRRKAPKAAPAAPQSPVPSRRSALIRVLREAFRAGVRTGPIAYSVLLSAAMCARVVASIKMARQLGVISTVLAARNWDALYATEVLPRPLPSPPSHSLHPFLPLYSWISPS